MAATKQQKPFRPHNAPRARAKARTEDPKGFARTTRAVAPVASFPSGKALALCVLAAAIGYALLPSAIGLFPDVELPISLMRGLVGGCVAGLLLPGGNRSWVAPAVAFASSVVGGAFVTLTSAGVTITSLLPSFAVAIAVAWLLAGIAPLHRGIPAQLVVVALVVLILLWFAGLVPGPIRSDGYAARQDQLSAHPQPEQYAFDGQIFMRTYDLMRQGEGFYRAYQQAVEEDQRLDSSSLASPFNYREPFVFYLWKLLPGSNSADIWKWFVAFSVIAVVASYVTAATLASPGIALLAPTALVAFYFYNYWIGAWFLLIEVWAAFFGILAIMCLVRKWDLPGLVFLTAAVAARELMLLFVVAWVVAWWFRPERRRRWWFAATAVAAPVAVLAAHLVALPSTPGGASAVTGWLHGSPAYFVAALGYAFDTMPLGLVVAPVIAMSALVSAAIAHPRWRAASLLAATVLPTLFLLVAARSGGNAYWGAFYMPIAVSIAPGVFGRSFPAHGASGERLEPGRQKSVQRGSHAT